MLNTRSLHNACLLFLGFGLLANSFSCTNRMKGLRTISVAGEGLIQIAPDQFEISAGIETADPDVKVVKARSDEVMGKVIATIKEFKVEDKDIQSDYVRIDPEYSQNPNENMRVVRFVARRSVRILLRDITQYDALSAKLFDQGTNILSDVSFRTSKKIALESEARLLAIRDAKQRADAMAKELGLTLGKALQVTDGLAPERPMPSFRAEFDMAKAAPHSSLPTVAAGQIVISANVSIVYEMD